MEDLTDFIKQNALGIVIGALITGSVVYFSTPNNPSPPRMFARNPETSENPTGTHTSCMPGSTRTIKKDGFVNGRQVTWTIHQTCHSLHP
jgi:hypothetical protein